MPPAAASSQLAGTNASASDWASDFHNLRISNGSPAMGGWQNEFMRQQQHTPQPHAPPQALSPIHHRLQPFQQAFQPSVAFPGQHVTSAASQGVAPEQPAETFDESAFEAAFEQARADMEMQQDDAESIPREQLPQEQLPQDQIRIGSDTIPQQQDNLAQNNGDELAKTAGQLLNSVSHEQDQKFKESSFLALMRRIRDREVEVSGDEFREVSTNP